MLIGKIRHEGGSCSTSHHEGSADGFRFAAVILNEHLTEALRRLKKDSIETSVDQFVPRLVLAQAPLTLLHRRLVSNVLITFLNTPRSDSKRFEMLQLLSSILSWTDEQREQVGLQRSSGLSAPSVIASGSRPVRGHARSGKGRSEGDGLGENEVSRLFFDCRSSN